MTMPDIGNVTGMVTTQILVLHQHPAGLVFGVSTALPPEPPVHYRPSENLLPRSIP
jgi:hypothetical protein